jgi:hypothetical protein
MAGFVPAKGIIPAAMEKAQHAIMGHKRDKISDLAQETKDFGPGNGRLTTDYGVKQTTADDWLRVVSEDQIGPGLLEDPFARERVRILTSIITSRVLTFGRFTGSITREFLSAWFMPAEAVPLGLSGFSRALRT